MRNYLTLVFLEGTVRVRFSVDIKQLTSQEVSLFVAINIPIINHTRIQFANNYPAPHLLTNITTVAKIMWYKGKINC